MCVCSQLLHIDASTGIVQPEVEDTRLGLPEGVREQGVCSQLTPCSRRTDDQAPHLMRMRPAVQGGDQCRNHVSEQQHGEVEVLLRDLKPEYLQSLAIGLLLNLISSCCISSVY